MKTVADIVEAVKSGSACTEEELRLALVCVDSALTLATSPVEENRPGWYYAQRCSEAFKTRFNVMRAEPSKWLGQDMPDNPDYQARRNKVNAWATRFVERIVAKQRAESAVAVLNRLVSADRKAIESLIEHRVECNEALVGDPTCQCLKSGNGHVVGLLGVINALFGSRSGGDGWIAANFESNNELIGFSVLKDPNEQE